MNWEEKEEGGLGVELGGERGGGLEGELGGEGGGETRS